MYVKMSTIDCTKSGNFYPGDIRKVDDKTGKELIDAGAAVEVKVAPKADNKKAPAEVDQKAEEAKRKNAAKMEEILKLEKEVEDLEKAAVEAEDLAKIAEGSEKKDAFKAAKAARKALDEASVKLNELKKSYGK